MQHSVCIYPCYPWSDQQALKSKMLFVLDCRSKVPYMVLKISLVFCCSCFYVVSNSLQASFERVLACETKLYIRTLRFPLLFGASPNLYYVFCYICFLLYLPEPWTLSQTRPLPLVNVRRLSRFNRSNRWLIIKHRKSIRTTLADRECAAIHSRSGLLINDIVRYFSWLENL